MSPNEPTVLLVDDEVDLVAAYAAWLGDDYDVRTAHGGEEALERFDEDVDVALLDRRMPDTSGDEVLAAIREQDDDCLVAMVTAMEPDFDVFDLGFDDYVVKPVYRDELCSLVDRLVRRSEYDDTIREQFAIASKLATLETYSSEAELARSDEYGRLQERLEELEERLSEHQRELSGEDFTAMLRSGDRQFS